MLEKLEVLEKTGHTVGLDNVSISVEAYTGYLPVIAYPLERKSCRNHFIPMGLSLNFGYRL